ncbi:MAG: cation diffusion facilitator family transporter [Deltaproteobacteria bacterium]|nr:cation diffusion facilitator family transporter [Deltaproteobacteria bacterium]
MNGYHNEKRACARLSIISNSALIVLKLAAGFFTGSVAIVGEAVHSFLDLLASLLAWGAVRVSDAPADYDHPFGHGKTENLAALFESMLIIVGGLYISYHSVLGLIEGRVLLSLKSGILVMLVSSLVNFFISEKLFKIGRATNSPALEADGWHLRTDVYTSCGILGALVVIETGHFLNPMINLSFIDSFCALGVSILILRAGWSLGWRAVGALVDHSLSPLEIKLIEDHIQAMTPMVIGFRRLRTRRSGPFRIILVDLLVDGRLSVSQAHELGVKVVSGVIEHFPEAKVTFHLEPVDIEKLKIFNRDKQKSSINKTCSHQENPLILQPSTDNSKKEK